MGNLITENVKVVDTSGKQIQINRLISDAGGQGDVYHVTYQGKDYALKWYKGDTDVIGGQQYKTIKNICGADKRPNEKFIWPLFLVTEENPAPGKRFGYLMELIPSGYHDMDDFLRKDEDEKKVRFLTYNALLTAGMNLASRMQALHLKGYSYKDLNPKNLCIHPQTGDVLIVDNDNVSVDKNGDSTVVGMKGYMAPEIVRSKYRLLPSVSTDRFSLAVVLYRLFFIDHPMDGKLWQQCNIVTEEWEDYLYALKPVFHFDPNDESNRPEGNYAPNATVRWNIYPQELRDLFITALTTGINAPNKRPPENAWITEISKCRDKLIRAGNGQEQFIDFDDLRTIPPHCYGLHVGNKRIALYHQKAIYEIGITGDSHQYAKMEAGILFSQKGPFIKNLSDHTWKCTSPDGKSEIEVAKDKTCPLIPGMKILFRQTGLPISGEVFDPRKHI